MSVSNPDKYPVLEMEMLTDVARGIYTVTTWYNDGSTETRKVPKGPILIPNPLCPEGLF